MSNAKPSEVILRGNVADLWEWLKRQCIITFKIIVCLILDGIIFCFWFLIAWGCYSLSRLAASKGFHEQYAEVFSWASSVSTLILAVTYIIFDIIRVFQDQRSGLKSKQKGE